MKRSGEIRRKAWMPRGTKRVRARNPKRRPKEWARAYGCEARVEWVKTLPCIVPHCCNRDIHNMHVVGGGAGRKADADKIVPACGHHHLTAHTLGIRTFSILHNLDLPAAAAATEQAWREVA